MKITCVSDLHGYYPKLEGGDLLLVAGDLTAHSNYGELHNFELWLADQQYRKKIVIAGNHDTYLCESAFPFDNVSGCEYLRDSSTSFEGLKIWGSPCTKTFEGMNPKCKAFTVDTEEELEEKFSKIPDDVDIVVTHSPPYGMMDKVFDRHSGKIMNCGSPALLRRLSRTFPKLHVFGHIHEGYGKYRPNLGFVDCAGWPIYVNASHVNEFYEPVNAPVEIEI